MGVTARIDVSRGERFERALRRYLSATLVTTAEGPAFSKFGVLLELVTLFEAGEILAELVPATAEHICALAPSGIPLGVVVSQRLRTPLSLYNPKGWERQGLSVNVRPDVPQRTSVALLDAHLRTGRSSRWCADYLKSRHDCFASMLCVPVAFEHCLDEALQVPTRALADSGLASSILSELTGVPRETLIEWVADMEGPFWKVPPSWDAMADEYRAKNAIAKWTEYAWGMGGILRKYPDTWTIPETKRLLSTLRNVASGRFETGVWDPLLHPDLLAEVCGIVGRSLDLSKYDYLVGVGHLGLVLAVALAYNNRDSYHGRILAWVGEYGLMPSVEDLRDSSVLPVTMRAQFGTYLMDVLRELRPRNARVKEVLIGIRDFNATSYLERMRQLSLTRMRQMGIRFICLF